MGRQYRKLNGGPICGDEGSPLDAYISFRNAWNGTTKKHRGPGYWGKSWGPVRLTSPNYSGVVPPGAMESPQAFTEWLDDETVEVTAVRDVPVSGGPSKTFVPYTDAGQRRLAKIPGVGPVKAARIRAHFSGGGDWGNEREGLIYGLLSGAVPGVGEKTARKVIPYLRQRGEPVQRATVERSVGTVEDSVAWPVQLCTVSLEVRYKHKKKNLEDVPEEWR